LLQMQVTAVLTHAVLTEFGLNDEEISLI